MLLDIAQCAHVQWPEPAAARIEIEETGRGHKEILLTLSRKGECGANDVFQLNLSFETTPKLYVI